MSPRALANKERAIQAQRVSKLSRAVLLLLATVLSFGTIALLVADQLYRPESFVIDQLKISGRFRHLEPVQIERIVQQQKLGNFFAVDLASIKHQVESLTWVEHADVRREWPNTLLISVSEHQPIMPWVDNSVEGENKKENHWLTSKGVVINFPEAIAVQNNVQLSGNQRDSQLILKQTYRWKKMVAGHGLRLVKVGLSDSHAWQLRLSYLNNEFDLLLGRDDVEQRLLRFMFLFDSEFKYADQQLTRVDARYPNGLAIKSVAIAKNEEVAMSQGRGSPL